MTVNMEANKKIFTLEDSIDNSDWEDWRWQQQNSVTSVENLVKIFPDLPEHIVENIRENSKGRKLALTPYVMANIQRDDTGRKPLESDAIWHQLIPSWDPTVKLKNDYDGSQDNWELPEEMKTPICQHKYPNRVILRVANVCHAYCQFCYEALRTLEKKSSKESLKNSSWEDTVNYIASNDEVEEVILSGGEPFMLADGKLESMLASLRAIDRDICIRIHTRALTFNPFRITPELVAMLKKYKVNSVGLHVAHSSEITKEFKTAVRLLSEATPIMFANIPLLAGVNDSYSAIKDLCLNLYKVGVIPHYLYHFMPFSPGLASYRTDVRKGQEIVTAMKRNITNLAVPEYVLPHSSGKFTLPLELRDEHNVEFKSDDNGLPVVEFTNWKGDRVQYSNNVS